MIQIAGLTILDTDGELGDLPREVRPNVRDASQWQAAALRPSAVETARPIEAQVQPCTSMSSTGPMTQVSSPVAWTVATTCASGRSLCRHRLAGHGAFAHRDLSGSSNPASETDKEDAVEHDRSSAGLGQPATGSRSGRGIHWPSFPVHRWDSSPKGDDGAACRPPIR